MKTIRMSVSIMAHPQRKKLVEFMKKRLDVHNTVVWDKKNSVWDTGRRALLSYRPDSTHHLVLQDDVIPAKNLSSACRKLLQFVPDDHPVCLYMGRARYIPNKYRMQHMINLARSRRASFAVFEGPWWGPGIIVPTHLIDDIVAFGDEHTEIPQYDHKISQFFTQRGTSCYYTMPSIVEHNTQMTDSLLGRGNGNGRRAAWYIGTRSAALYPWNRKIVTPADLPLKLRRNFPPSPIYNLNGGGIDIAPSPAPKPKPKQQPKAVTRSITTDRTTSIIIPPGVTKIITTPAEGE